MFVIGFNPVKAVFIGAKSMYRNILHYGIFIIYFVFPAADNCYEVITTNIHKVQSVGFV